MTSREHLDPYVVLGVCRQASPEEIARAYRRAARATHPDRAVSGTGAERFQAVSDAYDVLRDPGRRAGYDQSHPLPRRQTARARGSVRYAAPGSQHVVLGSSGPLQAGRTLEPVRDLRELRLVCELDDIEEAIRLALWWLSGS
jgi:curved DNA-binding protein CbpA